MAYRVIKKYCTSHPELDYGYYIDVHNILRPFLHSYDCRCHTCYDCNKDPSVSNTGSSSRSTASHAYKNQQDNQTANNSPPGTPTSHTSSIATLATQYSDEPFPDDGTANVVPLNIAKIFVSWTGVQIASSFVMNYGSRTLTISR